MFYNIVFVSIRFYISTKGCTLGLYTGTTNDIMTPDNEWTANPINE